MTDDMRPSQRELRDASLEAQVAQLKNELEDVLSPPLYKLANLLDRTLRRFPRFYEWLSR